MLSLSAPLALLLGLGLGAGSSWLAQRRQRRRQQPRQGPGGLPERQLLNWIQVLPQGWLVIAPDNSLASLNARAERLLELEPGQVRPGDRLQRLEPSDELLHLIELARQSQQVQRGRWPLRAHSLELRLLPGSQGWVAVVLQGSNPLQSQLDQQERWVSDVAHELKTPLTALRLVGESLALRAEGRQAVLVQRLQRELQRLQQLVNDLLDLSRLDNTPLVNGQARGSIDPRDVLGSIWSVLEPLAQPRQVTLTVHPGRDQTRLVAVDPGRLHQALFNLIENALRYSPDHTSISVTLLERGQWCAISVRDQGPGLSETDLERMFERFYRGDPARARSGTAVNGSGLGLAIVQQIARSQGGLVRAYNSPEGGAVLELLLPRAS